MIQIRDKTKSQFTIRMINTWPKITKITIIWMNKHGTLKIGEVVLALYMVLSSYTYS